MQEETQIFSKFCYPRRKQNDYFYVTDIIVGSGTYGRFLQNPLLVALQLIPMELGVGSMA